MISVYRADQLKRFAPFSYLNHSFILSLNVKVCIRFMVFLQIPLFLYLSRVMLDERFVHQLHIFMFFCFQSEGGVKNFQDWGVADLGDCFCQVGQYPITCHVLNHSLKCKEKSFPCMVISQTYIILDICYQFYIILF